MGCSREVLCTPIYTKNDGQSSISAKRLRHVLQCISEFSDFESGGQGFESLPARQQTTEIPPYFDAANWAASKARCRGSNMEARMSARDRFIPRLAKSA